MASPNKPQLSDDEVMAKLSADELAAIETKIARAGGEPAAFDVREYLHQHPVIVHAAHAAQVGRHLIGMKGENRAQVGKRLGDELVAEILAQRA